MIEASQSLAESVMGSGISILGRFQSFESQMLDLVEDSTSTIGAHSSFLIKREDLELSKVIKMLSFIGEWQWMLEMSMSEKWIMGQSSKRSMSKCKDLYRRSWHEGEGLCLDRPVP